MAKDQRGVFACALDSNQGLFYLIFCRHYEEYKRTRKKNTKNRRRKQPRLQATMGSKNMIPLLLGTWICSLVVLAFAQNSASGE